jgi:dihydroorotase
MRKLSNELVIIVVGVVCLMGVAITLYLSRDESKYTIKTEFNTYCVDNFRIYGKGVTFTTKSGDVVVSQGNFEIVLNKK